MCRSCDIEILKYAKRNWLTRCEPTLNPGAMNPLTPTPLPPPPPLLPHSQINKRLISLKPVMGPKIWFGIRLHPPLSQPQSGRENIYGVLSHCLEATTTQILGYSIEFRAQINAVIPGQCQCLSGACSVSLRQSVMDWRQFKLDLTFLQIDFGLIQSSLNICTSPVPLKRQYFKPDANWNMKINSQTLLGRSHHLLPLLKIFPASKAKPIYIANASIFFFTALPRTQNSKDQGERKKRGDFSFAGNLETLSS